jgi:hypothetical protein
MVALPQTNGPQPNFDATAALQRANQRIHGLEQENQTLRRKLRWEDELFEHPDLSPGQKLIMRSLYEQIALESPQGPVPLEIWRIARQTGQSDKTVGKAIQSFDQNNVLKRHEQHDRITQKTQISIEIPAPVKHPKLIQLAPRDHGGHRDPKPKCPACGGDLEVETAVECKDCGMKHAVGRRPATEFDTHLVTKFNELARIDQHIARESGGHLDGRSPFAPDEETIIEGSIEPVAEAAVILTGDPIEQEAAEESSDSNIRVMSEDLSGVPTVSPYTPPAKYDDLREAANLLLDIAGPGPKPEHVEMCVKPGLGKYITIHRPLRLSDTYSHIRGFRTKGATLQHPEGFARAICFDEDSPQGWERLKEAAVLLADVGLKPILEPSPVRDGDHVGGGHLWIIFETLVNAYAAYRTLCYRAPMLAEVKEYWPNTDARVRLPGGKYVKPGFEAWCPLYDVYGNELSHDGPGAAQVLLNYQSPVDLLIIAQKPIAQKALPPTRKRSTPDEQQGQSLVKKVIDDFNDRTSWDEIAALCGGFDRNRKFAASWRGDRTPNVAINPRTDRAKDFSTDAWLQGTMDKYDVWCLIQGGLNWESFKKQDLKERCRALEGKANLPTPQGKSITPVAVEQDPVIIPASELEALASELGAESCEPCAKCGCTLHYDHEGEMWCCRCLPKPRANWSDDVWQRLRALPKKVQALA